MLAVKLKGTLIHYPRSLFRCFISSAGICKAKDLRRPLRILSIARKRVQRERIPVEVIFQIKDARKTCAGEFRFVPGAVCILMLGEPSSRAFGQRDRWVQLPQASQSMPMRSAKPCSCLCLSAQDRNKKEWIRRSRHRDSARSAANSRRAGNPDRTIAPLFQERAARRSFRKRNSRPSGRTRSRLAFDRA